MKAFSLPQELNIPTPFSTTPGDLFTCFDIWTKVYPSFHTSVSKLTPPLTLANVSHLSRTLEGGMQSLGHHSITFSSRKFPSSKRPVASTSSPTHTVRQPSRYFHIRGQAEGEVKQPADHSTVCWKSFKVPSLPSAPGQFLTSSSTAWYCHFLKGEVLQLLVGWKSTDIKHDSWIRTGSYSHCSSNKICVDERWQSAPLIMKDWSEFIFWQNILISCSSCRRDGKHVQPFNLNSSNALHNGG